MSSSRFYFPALLAAAVLGLGVHAGDPAPAYLPLAELTERFAVESVVTGTNTTVWESPDVQVRFFDQSRRVEINGTLLWMNGGLMTNAAAQRMIAERDVETVLAPLLAPAAPVAGSNRFVVVLDAGHGGEDPGAIVTNSPPEKKLTLDIARRVRRMLRADKVNVRMTRRGDQTLALEERTAFAARYRGDVLVSIHVNKASNVEASGIETFVLPADGFPSTAAVGAVSASHPGNRHDAASTQLAFFIHRGMIDQSQAVDRGVKRARFEVLRNSPCPAVLVEIGFLSNTGELARLRETDYRERLAEGIVSGIRTYRRQNRLDLP